jgi:lysophospholipase L1-like esterase
LIDPTTATTVNSTILTQLILGGKTQVGRALDADPSFVSIWIGNNDVLVAGVTGLLNPTPGVSPGVTPLMTFQSSYGQMIQQLRSRATHLKGGVLIGVVNVANAPVLFPVKYLFNPQFKAGFDLYAGGAVTILPSCTPASTSLLSFLIVGAMRAGSHPRAVGCGKTPGTLVGDIFVLDSSEQVSLTDTVIAYNTYIEQQANTLGWAYYDPNPALDSLRRSGAIPPFPDLTSATQPFGTFISLDGIHPSAAAQVLIANGIIQAINAKYHVSVQQFPSSRVVARAAEPRPARRLRRPSSHRQPEA